MSDFSCFLPPKLGSPVACAIGEFFACTEKAAIEDRRPMVRSEVAFIRRP